MRCTSWLLAPAVAGLLALPAAAADTKKDPPGTSAIMGQLRATFAAWDRDDDGYLDKAELAKAFRGSDAKPYDFKPDKDGDPSKPTKAKPDYSKYPDYNFLVQLDKDGDGKISKDEFETWARDYAVALKQQLDALQRIAAAEQKLVLLQNAAATKEVAKEIRTIQQDLKKEQQAYQKMTKDARNFEKHLQQLMKQQMAKPHKK
jgi:Ca2+-binding EF-hand superfamily protein